MFNTYCKDELNRRLAFWLCCMVDDPDVDYYLCQQCGNFVGLKLISGAMDVRSAGRVDAEDVQMAFFNLLPDQRLVIYLKIVMGFSNQDVADILSRSIGAVKNIQQRALILLTHLLLPEYELTIA